MCVISAVIDQGIKDWDEVLNPNVIIPGRHLDQKDYVQVAFTHLQELMWKAAEYDKSVGNGNCEHGDKIKALRKIADVLGVDITIPGEERADL